MRVGGAARDSLASAHTLARLGLPADRRARSDLGLPLRWALTWSVVRELRALWPSASPAVERAGDTVGLVVRPEEGADPVLTVTEDLDALHGWGIAVAFEQVALDGPDRTAQRLLARRGLAARAVSPLHPAALGPRLIVDVLASRAGSAPWWAVPAMVRSVDVRGGAQWVANLGPGHDAGGWWEPSLVRPSVWALVEWPEVPEGDPDGHRDGHPEGAFAVGPGARVHALVDLDRATVWTAAGSVRIASLVDEVARGGVVPEPDRRMSELGLDQ